MVTWLYAVSLQILSFEKIYFGCLCKQKKSWRCLRKQLKCGARHCHAMIIWPHNVIILSQELSVLDTFWHKSSIHHQKRGTNGACPLGKLHLHSKENASPTSYSTSPRLSDSTFVPPWIYCWKFHSDDANLSFIWSIEGIRSFALVSFSSKTLLE